MDTNDINDRRAHRRLEIRLPLKYHKEGVGRTNPFMTMTVNVSTGGAYFETTAEDIETGDNLGLELEIPAGDGRFPLQGKIVTVGRVVRRTLIEDKPNQDGLTFPRYGVATEFQQGLNLKL